MKILLDTNALIWWFDDDRRLGRRARRQLADSHAIVLVTIVSLWEMTIKHRAGKFPRPGTDVLPFLGEQQIELIDLRLPHLRALNELRHYHNDPYDHLILAQAKAEGATLMTSDENMTLYGVPWIGTD